MKHPRLHNNQPYPTLKKKGRLMMTMTMTMIMMMTTTTMMLVI